MKSAIKTAIKKVLAFAAEKKQEEVTAALNNVYKLCDKAAGKGILHKNTVARKKSRITIAVNKLLAQ
jgi:small subunit ribosomal protein S20